MSEYPQGILRFPGIESIREWCFTMSHGVSPNIAHIEFTPQSDDLPTDPQTMTIEFGDTLFEFPFCVIDQVSIRRDPGGGMVCSATIKDRKWAWQYGKISGRYNLRNTDGTIYKPTEKTPQELAIILLKEMGERNYDVSALDSRPRPERNWDCDNPARELETLAEELGCRVVLQRDGKVLIALKGSGAELPDLGTQRTIDFGVDPPDRPDSYLLVGGPTQYESMFTLEAVGEDEDGSVKPIDDLSYKPSGGWAGEELGVYYNVGSTAEPSVNMQKARATVFRWYRISGTVGGTSGEFNVPGFTGDFTVTQLWQVLPLLNRRVGTYFDNDGVEHPRPARLTGKWYQEGKDDTVNATLREYDRGFTIDCDRGIVQLSEPAAIMNSDGTFAAAKMYLQIAHPVKASATATLPYVEDRYEQEQKVPGDKTGAGKEILKREDVIRKVYGTYDTTKDPPQLTDVTENTDKLYSEAYYYLGAAVASVQTRTTGHVEYAGLVDISPDGAIHQVEWKGGASGCTTAAGVNLEFSLIVPKYENRRIKQKVAGLYDQTPFGRVQFTGIAAGRQL